LSSIARAQEAREAVEGAGIKVGEGTVLHPVVGIETGVVQNVFYEDDDPVLSGLLRLSAEFAVGSLPPERLQATEDEDERTHNYGDLALRLEGGIHYEEYLTSNDVVRTQRNVTGDILARGIIFPRQTWQLHLSDEFSRTQRPVNFESEEDIYRDINRVGVQLHFRPRQRSIRWALRYQNVVDYFEDADQQFANRIQHTVGLNFTWQWLPVTRLYADASIGIFRPLGSDSTRIPSYPLRITTGIATALSVKSSVHAHIGFAKGFYESGPDFTNVTGGIQYAYRLGPFMRLAAQYEYDFNDSINANFYRDHALMGRIDYWLDRLWFNAVVEARLRKYSGVIMEVAGNSTDRDDLIFSLPVGVVYNFQRWIAATLDYRLSVVTTDFRYMPATCTDPGGCGLDDPSYVRHSLMAGIRAAY